MKRVHGFLVVVVVALLTTSSSYAITEGSPISFQYTTFEEEGLAPGWETSVNSFNDLASWQRVNSWSSQGDTSLNLHGKYVKSASLSFAGYTDDVTFSFQYRTRFIPSYTTAYLFVYVDGSIYLRETTLGDWEGVRNFRHELDAGYHTIEIRYYYGVSGTITFDIKNQVWLDFVVFEGADKDIDSDGLPNLWEVQYGLDPRFAEDAVLDSDGDGLDNLAEFQNGTNPFKMDTDDDGASDWVEVMVSHTSPTNKDTDYDMMLDGFEIQYGLNPFSEVDADLDNDGDGLSNFDEFRIGSDPTDPLSAGVPVTYWRESFENGVSDKWEFFTSGIVEPLKPLSDWASDGQQSAGVREFPEYSYLTMGLTDLFADGTLYLDYFVDAPDLNRKPKLNVVLSGPDPFSHIVSGVGKRTLAIPVTAGVHRLAFFMRSSTILGSIGYYIDNIRFVSNQDADDDGLPDDWETLYGLDPLDPTDAALDSDRDGLDNLSEFEAGSDPTAPDVDLEISMEQSFDTGASEISYRIHVLNNGVAPANGVSVTSFNERGLSFSEVSSGENITCEALNSQLSCAFGVLSAQETAYVEVSVPISSDETYLFTSEVTSLESDYDYKNNKATGTYAGSIDIDADGLPNEWESLYGLDPRDPSDATGDLDEDGLDNLAEFSAGSDPTAPDVELAITMSKLFDTNSSEIRYRIRVENNGVASANEVTVNSFSGAGFSLNVMSAADGITCDSLDSQLSCIFGGLGPQEFRQVDVSVLVDTKETYTFSSEVRSLENDYDSDNNRATGAYAGSMTLALLIVFVAGRFVQRAQ
ncbi:MAG: hypothetical protein VYA55_12605 [Pseudomonadota bacterium]|nr:hypothetical protein [Pseudomonadota bacterium]